MELIHCQRCNHWPYGLSDGSRRYVMTGCGRLFCQVCIQALDSKCPRCTGNCNIKEVKADMGAEMKLLFSDPATVFLDALKKACQVAQFQRKLQMSLYQFGTKVVDATTKIKLENDELKSHTSKLKNEQRNLLQEQESLKQELDELQRQYESMQVQQDQVSNGFPELSPNSVGTPDLPSLFGGLSNFLETNDSVPLAAPMTPTTSAFSQRQPSPSRTMITPPLENRQSSPLNQSVCSLSSVGNNSVVPGFSRASSSSFSSRSYRPTEIGRGFHIGSTRSPGFGYFGQIQRTQASHSSQARASGNPGAYSTPELIRSLRNLK